jgi:hypothetical protein
VAPGPFEVVAGEITTLVVAEFPLRWDGGDWREE